jgi:hypothetical protein
MRVQAISSILVSITPVSLAKPIAASINIPQPDPMEGPLRALLTQIKHSHLSRGQRDSLCAMIRSAAAEDRFDFKTIKSILEIVFLLETIPGKNSGKETAAFPSEKTVDDELDEISEIKSARAVMQDNLDKLRDSFSKLA